MPRWEDTTVGPFRCLVCGGYIGDPTTQWVRSPRGTGPVYGLHSRCTGVYAERVSWDDGRPTVKPSLEDRIAALEKRLGTD